jgi:ubiquitin-protein ligase
MAGRIRRITKELKQLLDDTPAHIYVDYDDANLTHLEVLFIGPRHSPYSRMFMRFAVDFPEQYPIKPPKVVFTSSYQRKIHPNVFPGGWLCLSTLNSTDGAAAGWVPSINITALLATVYSMFTQEMIQIDNTHSHDKSVDYFPAVMYDTFYITSKLLNDERNPKFKKVMENYLEKHRDWYLRKIDRLGEEHDGKDLKNYYEPKTANFKGLRKAFE